MQVPEYLRFPSFEDQDRKCSINDIILYEGLSQLNNFVNKETNAISTLNNNKYYNIISDLLSKIEIIIHNNLTEMKYLSTSIERERYNNRVYKDIEDFLTNSYNIGEYINVVNKLYQYYPKDAYKDQNGNYSRDNIISSIILGHILLDTSSNMVYDWYDDPYSYWLYVIKISYIKALEDYNNDKRTNLQYYNDNNILDIREDFILPILTFDSNNIDYFCDTYRFLIYVLSLIATKSPPPIHVTRSLEYIEKFSDIHKDLYLITQQFPSGRNIKMHAIDYILSDPKIDENDDLSKDFTKLVSYYKHINRLKSNIGLYEMDWFKPIVMYSGSNYNSFYNVIIKYVIKTKLQYNNVKDFMTPLMEIYYIYGKIYELLVDELYESLSIAQDLISFGIYRNISLLDIVRNNTSILEKSNYKICFSLLDAFYEKWLKVNR